MRGDGILALTLPPNRFCLLQRKIHIFSSRLSLMTCLTCPKLSRRTDLYLNMVCFSFTYSIFFKKKTNWHCAIKRV
ncbi:hypothetical protein ACJX0J_026456, partial [Zea mays]